MTATTQESSSPRWRLPRIGHRQHLYRSCLTILLLSSATINVLLTREITGLTTAIHHLKLELGAASQPQIGQPLPPIQARDMDGAQVTLNSILSGDKATVIYVFSPSCKWCNRNLENIRTLAEGVKERFQIVGLSVTDRALKEYVKRSGLAFPIYTLMPAIEAGFSKGTPRTLVISRDGKVVVTWFGAFGGDLRKKVEEYFGLSLPGLLDDETAGREAGKLTCE